LRRHQPKPASSHDGKTGDGKVDAKTPLTIVSSFPIVDVLSLWSTFLMALFMTLTLGWAGESPMRRADDGDKRE